MIPTIWIDIVTVVVFLSGFGMGFWFRGRSADYI